MMTFKCKSLFSLNLNQNQPMHIDYIKYQSSHNHPISYFRFVFAIFNVICWAKFRFECE